MSTSPVEEIKAKLDIVDLIKEYVQLEKAGSNYRALCPFHSEKTPSFFVNPSRQIWRCFGGCSEGGDIFKFVMKIEGVDFREALSILAKKAGVELKKGNFKERSERDKLLQICELSTKFFEKQLASSKPVKEYLKKRGMREEEVKEWRLGYSPDSWRGLSDFLIGKGFKKEDIEKTGLLIIKEGKFYDRFRGRIIFPIFDLTGKVIAFGGRIFKEEKGKAKYINSPQTSLYDKSKVLYGLDRAKVEIRRKDFLILTEGYTDVIMLSKAGSKNVVSTSGTSLAFDQIRTISRYSKNICLAFDMDEAGRSAAKKGIEMLLKEDFNVKVASLPQGSDPADLILKDIKLWKKALKESKSVIQFYFDSTLSSYDIKDPKGKKEAAKEVIPMIKKISSDIERDHWTEKLSKEIEVEKEAVLEEMKKVKEEEKEEEKEEKEEEVLKSRKEGLEERIIFIISKDSERVKEIKNLSLFSEKTKKIIKGIKEGKEDEEVREIIDYFSLKPGLEEENIDEELKDCLKELKKEKLKEDLKKIEREIEKAEKDKDEKKEEKLIKMADKISKELQKL